VGSAYIVRSNKVEQDGGKDLRKSS